MEDERQENPRRRQKIAVSGRTPLSVSQVSVHVGMSQVNRANMLSGISGTGALPEFVT